MLISYVDPPPRSPRTDSGMSRLNMRDWLGNAEVTDIDPMSPFTTSIKFQRSQPLKSFGTYGKVSQVRKR